MKTDNNLIPEWWPKGRTVLIPKTKSLSDERNYRPITCLNTLYKILTGIIAKYMRKQSKGYRIGEPGNRIVYRTHSLFVDDLKQYQESHQKLKNVSEMLVQASHDTVACYGVSKCAEIIFEHGKMIKGEGLQVLEERMQTMDPDENEIYKFLGVEQADGIKTKAIFERVKAEVTKRVRMLVDTELNDANLISAINAKVISVASYPMNICKFSNGELNQLDQVIRKELRVKNMLGRQASDERLYLKREAAEED